MNLEQTFRALKQHGYSFRPKGFFNVEGGDAAIATQMFVWCDCLSLTYGPTVSSCGDCHRGPGNFVKVPAGDGDSVYVVFEVYQINSPQYAVGAFTVFDHRYEIANKVRSFVEEQGYLSIPWEEVLVFGDSVPTALDQLSETSSIYFADGTSGGANSSNANVDVQFGGDVELTIFGFLEPMSTDPEENAKYFATNWNMEVGALRSNMQASLAIAQSLAESLGRELTEPLPPYSIRCLMALQSDLVAEIGLESEAEIDDWEMFSIQVNGRVVSSHIQPQDVSTVWMNAMLAREIDRQAGEVSEAEAKRLLFDMWTWAYQGLVAGDGDCLELIKNRYQPTPDEIAELLRRRGLFDITDNFLATGQLSGLLSEVIAAQSPPGLGLTKSGSLGLGLGENKSKFCSNCGQAFGELAKFCAECGNARNSHS